MKLLRKILGTEQLIRKQKTLMDLVKQQRALTLSVGNAVKYLAEDQTRVRAMAEYKACAGIVTLLAPMDLKHSGFIRLGKDNDGGYVIVDDLAKIEAAYSLGLSDDVSWDQAVAQKGVEVFMYDHTIKKAPGPFAGSHYFKIGVTGFTKGPGLKTLEELIIDNKHAGCENLILKMDVEGSEWDVFDQTASSVLDQFTQIIVEFHDLKLPLEEQKFRVLEKLHTTHQSTHVHANNFGPCMWIGDLVLPASLEVTYVRRRDFHSQLAANSRKFPTVLDQPCNQDCPDIYLGNFSV